jgi:hypothetical protein
VLHKVGAGSVCHRECAEVSTARLIPFRRCCVYTPELRFSTTGFCSVCGCSYSGVWLITRCGSLVRSGYNIQHEILCVLVLVANGVVFRCVAFFCMVTFQKH